MKSEEEILAINIFSRTFGGDMNMFTPIPVEYGIISKHFAYELSRSNSEYNQIFEHELFGVTIVYYDLKTGEYTNCHQLGKSFDNIDSAREYIQQRKNEIVEDY